MTIPVTTAFSSIYKNKIYTDIHLLNEMENEKNFFLYTFSPIKKYIIDFPILNDCLFGFR